MKDKEKNYIIGSKHAKNFIEKGHDPYADNVQIDMQAAFDITQEEDNYVLNNKKKLRREKQAKDMEGIYLEVSEIVNVDGKDMKTYLCDVGQPFSASDDEILDDIDDLKSKFIIE